MADWVEELMNAKYHLSIAKRMCSAYTEFPEKRFMIGIVKELSKASSRVIKAYLRYTNKRRLGDFKEIIAKQYLEKKVSKDLMIILEIERAQALSPIQFSKEDKIILLVQGKYKILTLQRLKELIHSVEEAVFGFPRNIRQI